MSAATGPIGASRLVSAVPRQTEVPSNRSLQPDASREVRWPITKPTFSDGVSGSDTK
jgi:hypothetical protein